MPVDTNVDHSRYDTRLDIKYPHLAVIDIPAIAADTTHPWFNQTLTKVNDAVVRLGIVCGEYHWHKHDHDDEFFLVLDGELHIDIENGQTVTLAPQQGFTVPRGTVHRPRAPKKTTIVMVETAQIVPTGSAP